MIETSRTPKSDSPPQMVGTSALLGHRAVRGWLDANGLGCRTLWERHIHGACILREAHDKGCSCSYCKEGRVGIVLPENKGRNSWRALQWKWRGKLHVLRWTLPKWCPNDKDQAQPKDQNQPSNT